MPRTQSERLWVVGAAVVALLMAVVGYFLLVGPQRARTAAVRGDVTAASFQTTTLQARITSLTAQSRQLASYRAALARARQALPAADDLTATPNLLRSLAATAAATSTSITSLTVGDPTAVVAAAAPAAPATGTPASSASSTPTAPAAAAAPALSSIAVGATVTGSTAQLNAFLAALQTSQPRALLVSAVTLTGHTDTGSHAAGLNLTMTAFVRPATASATPGTAPGR